MFASTDTGGNTPEAIGNRGSAWQSIRFGFHAHGRPRNRKITVSFGFYRFKIILINIKY
jgi:hypothetical protein